MWTIVKYYITSSRPWIALLIMSFFVFYHQAALMEGNYILYFVFTIYSYYFIFISAGRGDKLRIISSQLPINNTKVWIAKSLSFMAFTLSQFLIVIVLDQLILGGKIDLLYHFRDVVLIAYFLSYISSAPTLKK